MNIQRPLPIFLSQGTCFARWSVIAESQGDECRKNDLVLVKVLIKLRFEFLYIAFAAYSPTQILSGHS